VDGKDRRGDAEATDTAMNNVERTGSVQWATMKGTSEVL
jgi:hypothetical protein